MASNVMTFISCCLVAYFIYEIVVAAEKLRERRIGATLTRKEASTVTYPAMTFCPFNNE